MKKFLKVISLLAFVALFAMSMFFLTFNFCEVLAESDYQQTEQYQLLNDFVTANPQRSYGSQGERNARDWLKNKLIEFGFAASDLTQQKIDDTGNSFNLIAKINSQATSDRVIIGAHYDAYGGQGASDNGTGVVALLLIARQLLQNQSALPFNIEIVFFGSEEAGFVGSSKYVSQMTAFDLAQTKLMINLDCIGYGDKLYILGEEVFCDFQRIFVEGAANSPETLHNKPLGKGIFTALDEFGMGYYQRIQASDHTPFRMAGIPVLFFFSGTYDTIHGDYLESANADFRIMNSSRDTLVNVNKRGAAVVDKIQTVQNSICKTILNADNAQIIANAKSQLIDRAWFNSMFIYLAGLAILLVLGLFAYLHSKKLLKQSLLGSVSAVKKERLFNSPKSEDIFDLNEGKRNTKPKDNKDNTDDIFKF